MPRSHVETRDHLIETTSSSETVLFVIGHVREFLRYTDIHGHIYGKWKDPNDREIQHYQILRGRPSDRWKNSFLDDFGIVYVRMRLSPDMIPAHLDDCLDTQTHPRLVELR